MAVPLLDLKAQHATLAEAVERALHEVLAAQSFILGPVVERFERRVAEELGVPYAIGVSSGTDALYVSLLAEGVGPGDEVVTTPFSFFATAGAILRTGARPIFVDIDPATYNLNPEGVPPLLSPRTRALLPVHLFGCAAHLEPLLELARDRRLALIEDAAQAFGTEVSTAEDGQRVSFAGTLGTYGCFSFFPSKNLGGAGDGGLVVCADADRALRVRRLRVHGASQPHLHETLGGNFRLDALQAAILEVKLSFVAKWVRARRRKAERYRQLFSEAGLTARGVTFPSAEAPIALPAAVEGHSYNQFVVRAFDREGLRKTLTARGIGHAVYYPRPLHLQPSLAFLGYGPGAFPHAERAAAEVLALPIYPELDEAQQQEVVGVIADHYADRRFPSTVS